ncbi:ATP-binding cassette domain-containing protein [Deinococcus maricopensis]|uniref:ATP-binding cassette domain-containing protein n=1 Tax=Deinococcus maricopensis TaxID=309887 RepID=UPI000975CE47
MGALLQAQHLHVTLDGYAVLDDLSFSVQRGDLVHLRGPNGAGKSTLLRALAGLTERAGDITLDRHAPHTLAARARFAYVPDDAPLYDDLTVQEHVRFTALAYGVPEGPLLDALARFGLHDHLLPLPGGPVPRAAAEGGAGTHRRPRPAGHAARRTLQRSRRRP